LKRLARAWLFLLSSAGAAIAVAGEWEDARDALNRGDYDGSLPVIRSLGEQGDPRAQNTLGILYQRGRGVAQDDAEAVRWYRKAAEQGFGFAEDNLGVMYRDGRGVSKDESEAVVWFRKAAEHGNAEGQNNLGAMYQKGRGVAKDDAEAVLWYRKAADQRLAVAQNNLGVMLRDGLGVTRDYDEAVRFFRLAADKEFARAQENLGYMYRTGRGVAQDDAEAMRWFRKAVESGRPTAQAEVAYMYETGRGVARDDAEALRWYWNAANQGNAYSQRRLATFYRDGRGTERNPEAAIEWFGKAAAQGDKSAQVALTALQGQIARAAQARAITQAVKARDAANPAPPIVDAERAALVRELSEATSIRGKFARWVEGSESTDFANGPLQIPDKLKSAVRESFAAAFSADAVVDLFEAYLAESLDARTLRVGLDWELSPVGRRTNELDLDADSRVKKAARQEFARQYRSKGTFGDDSRARACAQVDALSDQTESSVPFIEAIAATGVLVGIELKGNPADIDSVQGLLARMRPLFRETARLSTMSDCLVNYRDLTDAEFDQWLAFLRSTDGGNYQRAVNSAIRQAMVARSIVMTESLLEAVKQYKRETQISQDSEPVLNARS